MLINDDPEVALQSGAHGVHLGQSDWPVREARYLLGKDKIIGGTANTLKQMETLVYEGVDYIGLGPFRFTSTKERLSPLLGADGYRARMNAFRAAGYATLTVLNRRLEASNTVDSLRGFEVVADATDNFAARYALDAACERLRLPFVYGSAEGWGGQVPYSTTAGQGAIAICIPSRPSGAPVLPA